MDSRDIAQRWTFEKALEKYEQPFLNLVFEAQSVHRQHFEPNTLQVCGLENIKIGGCPEDCAWCGQSVHNKTGVKSEPLPELATLIEKAREAKARGVMRYCMAASFRSPTQRQLAQICEMIRAVKELGLETCITIGKLNAAQAHQLKQAGLDYYNHNLESSARYFSEVTSRNYQDRLNTLTHVSQAGMKVCSGGIVGMGETLSDRIDMLVTLANQPSPVQSVPINQLVPIPGTPLENTPQLSELDFVRIVALTRIMMPTAYVRLSGGRKQMSQTLQTLCFVAGANSIHHSPQLLVTPNVALEEDMAMIDYLGLQIESAKPTPKSCPIPITVNEV